MGGSGNPGKTVARDLKKTVVHLSPFAKSLQAVKIYVLKKEVMLDIMHVISVGFKF